MYLEADIQDYWSDEGIVEALQSNITGVVLTIAV